MIKNITPGTGITVNNGHSSWPSFYNSISSTGNNLVGQMRYNGSSQTIEVYDGTVWLTLSSSFPTVDLAPHVQAVVAWAQNKMAEETHFRELAEKYPAVADAIDHLKEAEARLRVITALVQE